MHSSFEILQSLYSEWLYNLYLHAFGVNMIPFTILLGFYLFFDKLKSPNNPHTSIRSTLFSISSPLSFSGWTFFLATAVMMVTFPVLCNPSPCQKQKMFGQWKKLLIIVFVWYFFSHVSCYNFISNTHKITNCIFKKKPLLQMRQTKNSAFVLLYMFNEYIHLNVNI